MQTGNACFAGIWQDSFELNLLWKDQNAHLCPISAEYYAPSWSWASIEGPITIPLPGSSYFATRIAGPGRIVTEDNLVAHVIDVHVESVGQDPLGVLSGGSVKLLTQTMVRVDPAGGFRTYSFAKTGQLIKGAFALSHETQSPLGEGLFLLPVLCDTLDNMAGLILCPTGVKQGQYRRIGTFEVAGGMREMIIAPTMRADENAFVERLVDGRFPDAHWAVDIV